MHQGPFIAGVEGLEGIGVEASDAKEVLVCIENPTLARALEEAINLIEPFHAVGVVFDIGALLKELERVQVHVVVLDGEILARSWRELLQVFGHRHTQVKVLQVGGWRSTEGPVGESLACEQVVPYDATVEDLEEALRLACFGRKRPETGATARERLLAWAPDVGALALLFAFVAYLARDLFKGEYLFTEYGDWPYQAYKLKSMMEYGFLTWSNDWSGGFAVWQGYQFLPHVATLLLKWVTGWSITKAMVFAIGVLFVLFRLIFYTGLRLAGFPAPVALIGAMLTLAMVGYYRPLTDFSLLWGVSLFPVALFLLPGPGGSLVRVYATAALVGFGIYVHPIFAILGTITLVCYFVTSGEVTLREALSGLGIVFLTSAFFWFPVMLGDRPEYQNLWEISASLQRLLFPTEWLGLSASMIAVGVALGASFLAAKGFRLEGLNRRLLATSGATLGVVLPTVLAAYFGLTPGIVNEVEPARWMPFAGILLAILGAFVVQSVYLGSSRQVILLIALGFIAADALVIAKGRLPTVSAQLPEPRVVQALSEYGRVSYGDRVISRSDVVPDISFFHFGEVRLAGNYFGKGAHEILMPALMWLLFSNERGSTVESGDATLALAYMKAIGGTYFIVPETYPIARALVPEGELAGVLPLRQRTKGFTLFEVPGAKAQAIITTRASASEVLFPDVKYDTDGQRKERDRLVLRFAELIEAPGTIVPTARYPSQTEIIVEAADVPREGYLIVFAPYDSAWEVTIDGKVGKVERAGPYFIGIDLSNLEGVAGVHLVHGMHWTWKVGMALTAIGALAFGFLTYRAGGYDLRIWLRKRMIALKNR
ncbi:MAG: hypothetical protein HY675_03665 [Chloroflexi bacterium]|nr:hypothetical protein [Chloroflexota bacterium]